MEANTVQAFAAIKQFVDALAETYEKKHRVSPLLLYKRLLTFVRPDARESTNIEKFLRGFKLFYDRYDEALVSDQLNQALPVGTHIKYSKNAYIDIQKFVHKSKNSLDVRTQIRVHLLTIQAFLETDDAKANVLLQQVSNSEKSSREDKFVGSIVQKAQAAIENLDPSIADDPMKAVAGLVQSGVLSDMILGLQESVGSGEMDPSKLLQAMQGTMSKVVSESSSCFGENPGDHEPDENRDVSSVKLEEVNLSEDGEEEGDSSQSEL